MNYRYNYLSCPIIQNISIVFHTWTVLSWCVLPLYLIFLSIYLAHWLEYLYCFISFIEMAVFLYYILQINHWKTTLALIGRHNNSLAVTTRKNSQKRRRLNIISQGAKIKEGTKLITPNLPNKYWGTKILVGSLKPMFSYMNRF